MNSRIIALNLPAKASQEVAGNPVISRLESAIANCFPGLEIDHRNLDRRFFPGLIFEFVSNSSVNPDSNSFGARLVGIDLSDPDVPKEDAFSKRLEELQIALANGKKIFLHSLRQGSSAAIELRNKKGSGDPFDGLIAWRLVRSLASGEVTIVLSERGEAGREQNYHEITAHRRTYQDKDGMLSAAFQPGELSQSLCSPWQHDFRDCSCNYWASNHPDIVMAAHPDSMAELKADTVEAEQADHRLIWLRWNQSKPTAPLTTREECRPFEMDHYEINEQWQDLAIVLEGRERHIPYVPGPIPPADPFSNLRELVEKLRELAGIEHALALEYLYARYSMRVGEALDPSQQQHANYIAHELLMIAASEMMHLRWVNQLLWELWHLRHTSGFVPELSAATYVPGRGGLRKVAMRPLDRAIDDFIAAEAPSGTIEGQYARVFATLRHGYPASLPGLASRIIADGVSHFTRFREIRAILRHYGNSNQVTAARRGTVHLVQELVREITVADIDNYLLNEIKSLYGQLICNLQQAYRSGSAEEREGIGLARQVMMELDEEAIGLAQKGLGIPFSEIAYSIVGKYNNDPKCRNQR
jgi:hypothetical protein